jgi:gliding motility-associated-like protein
VTLKATNSVDFAWTPEESLSCTDCASPVATPDTTTTYVVSTVTGLNCIPTDTVTVTVTHFKKLFIPTAFTPNGDGQNDVFRVKGLGIAYFSMQVFNRVGNLVYQTEDYSSGWDGKVREELAPTGTYVYMIQYAFYGDEMHPQLEKGTVTLIW